MIQEKKKEKNFFLRFSDIVCVNTSTLQEQCKHNLYDNQHGKLHSMQFVIKCLVNIPDKIFE